MNVKCGSLLMAVAVAALGGMAACTTDKDDPGAGGGSGGISGGMGGAGGMTTVPDAGGGPGGEPPGTACATSLVVPASRPGITTFDAYDGVSDLATWNSPLGGDSSSNAYAGPFSYGDRTTGFPET